jgi:hypothetical protein
MTPTEERDRAAACMDAMAGEVEGMDSAEDALDHLIQLALTIVDSTSRWKEPCLTRVYARVFHRFHRSSFEDHKDNSEFTRQNQVKEHKT